LDAGVGVAGEMHAVDLSQQPNSQSPNSIPPETPQTTTNWKQRTWETTPVSFHHCCCDGVVISTHQHHRTTRRVHGEDTSGSTKHVEPREDTPQPAAAAVVVVVADHGHGRGAGGGGTFCAGGMLDWVFDRDAYRAVRHHGETAHPWTNRGVDSPKVCWDGVVGRRRGRGEEVAWGFGLIVLLGTDGGCSCWVGRVCLGTTAVVVVVVVVRVVPIS